MNPRLFCIVAMCIGCFAASLTGCSVPAAQAPQPTLDPFACPPGCVPHCTPDNCPPGCCPLPRNEVQGIEVGSSGPAHPVNSLAQNEVKSGQCLPCQPHAIIPHQPQASTPQRTAPPQGDSTDEVKRGSFRCERCQRPTVGEQWQEIWSDDGVSLLCLCKRCYAEATPAQRESVMRSYLSRHGINPAQRPLVEAAVVEASRGY